MKHCHIVIFFNFTGTPDEPGIIKYFLRPIFLGSTLKSMADMEDYLKDSCSDIDFTVVRPPGLTNDPSSGKVTNNPELIHHVLIT